jgi:hypothetical protein
MWAGSSRRWHIRKWLPMITLLTLLGVARDRGVVAALVEFLPTRIRSTAMSLPA